MPVHTIEAEKQPMDTKTGKPFRHINPDCPILKKNPPAERRFKVPNTEALRERTARCMHPDCWPVWIKADADRRKAAKDRQKKAAANAAKKEAAAATPATAQAKATAQRARAGRTKRSAAGTASK